MHAVSVDRESTVRPISDAHGGVFISFGSEDAALGFDSLASRFAEAALIDGVDSDRDGIGDCREQLGSPILEGIVWEQDGERVNEFDADFWINTNPNDPDTDGDFLWDSEELIPIDLTSRADLARDYADVISAGFPVIYRNAFSPTDRFTPVDETGDFTTGAFVARSPESLASAKLDFFESREDRLAGQERLSQIQIASEAFAAITLSNPRQDLDRFIFAQFINCLLYTSPSPRDRTRSRMPSSA